MRLRLRQSALRKLSLFQLRVLLECLSDRIWSLIQVRIKRRSSFPTFLVVQPLQDITSRKRMPPVCLWLECRKRPPLSITGITGSGMWTSNSGAVSACHKTTILLVTCAMTSSGALPAMETMESARAQSQITSFRLAWDRSAKAVAPPAGQILRHLRYDLEVRQ